ncbi:MAG: PEP-CTERM sorting domain-containing protein [Phycisphaerae bacterium]|nr:PEP-CTERM sorting domain-containing protein [Gemmatimonadaceae bacterium]
MRRDANWLYTAFRTTGGMNAGGLLFANLYFSLRSGPGPFGSSGSSIGFEIPNDRAFKPGGACCFNDNGSNLIRFATSSSAGNPDVLESAIDMSVFLGNALNVTGYNVDPNAVGVRLNLSQTFGYSVVGGATYGDPATGPALGYVSTQSVVPEPSTYALMFAGLAAVGVAARRRRNA